MERLVEDWGKECKWRQGAKWSLMRKSSMAVFKSCCSPRGAEANGVAELGFHLLGGVEVWDCTRLFSPFPKMGNSLKREECLVVGGASIDQSFGSGGLPGIFTEKLNSSPFYIFHFL